MKTSRTVPTQIIDKNGKKTTVHKTPTSDNMKRVIKQAPTSNNDVEVPENLLTMDEHSPEVQWGQKYRIKLAKTIAREGRPLDSKPSVYGWVDDRMAAHLNNCKITELTKIYEDEWVEFAGTFTDDNECRGFNADARCECGKFDGQLRMEGTLGEFIQRLSAEDILDER